MQKQLTLNDAGNESPGISIVIPVLDEKLRIERCISEIHSFFSAITNDWEVVVADAASNDATPEILRRLQSTNSSFLRWSSTPRRTGKGRAVRLGLEMCRGKYVFLMDCDFSIPLSLTLDVLQDFIEDPGLDLVLGSRRQPDSRVLVPLPRPQRLLDRRLNSKAQNLFGWNHEDIFCPFVAMTGNLASELSQNLTCDDHAYPAEILLYCREKNMQVQRRGVMYRHDRGSRFWAVKHFWRSARSMHQLSKRFASGLTPEDS